MEVVTIDKKNGIRIKGKQASLVVDPSNTTKIPADAILLLQRHGEVEGNIEGARLIIRGAGEYEVGGIKISVIGSGDLLAYRMSVDNVDLCIIPSDLLGKIQDKIGECNVLIISVTNKIEEAAIAPYAPRAVVIYGEGINDSVMTSLGKENVTTSSKFQMTTDKFPEEMAIVVLQ